MAEIGVAWLYLAPAILILGLFRVVPIVYTAWLSLTEWNMMTPNKTFIGFDNYARLFADPVFRQSLRNTAVFTIAQVGIGLALGLALAVLLNGRRRELYRAAVFSPHVVAMSAVAILWIWLFDPLGPLNKALAWMGLRSPNWLSDPAWALWALVIVNIWYNVGYNAVVFLAGLQDIPGELLEAARIDGASPWTTFWRVTLPLLSPITFFLLTVSLIWSFQVFDSVKIMTEGGPLHSTYVIVYYLYIRAFRFFEAGYASAAAMVLFAIVLAISWLQVRASRHWVHYA